MPHIRLYLEGDNAWPELEGIDVTHLQNATWHLAALPEGMASGKPSLALRLDLPDGRVIVAETSLELWVAATVGLKARYPEAFTGTPLAGPVYSTKEKPNHG